MSYDLALFDPALCPNDRDEFLEWFRIETTWSGGLDYNDPSNLPSSLLPVFNELIKTFPPINGPSKTDGDELIKTDYCCSNALIYAGFRWSESKTAYNLLQTLAAEFECGFFDVSSIGSAIWIPDGGCGLLKHSQSKPWWKMW